jgi:hypothetical protein
MTVDYSRNLDTLIASFAILVDGRHLVCHPERNRGIFGGTEGAGTKHRREAPFNILRFKRHGTRWLTI